MTAEEELAALRAKLKASLGKGGLGARIAAIRARIAILEAENAA